MSVLALATPEPIWAATPEVRLDQIVVASLVIGHSLFGTIGHGVNDRMWAPRTDCHSQLTELAGTISNPKSPIIA